MKLHVTHRTRYDYPTAVIESFNETRLQPTSADGQVCHSFLLKVLPSTQLKHYLDFYLNCVHFFEIPEAHTSLSIESNSVVSTVSRILPPEQQTVPMSRLKECYAMEQCYDFLQPSKHVGMEPAAWRLAVDATLDEKDAWRAAVKIMEFIHSSFEYEPEITTVHTPIADIVEHRKGVCQDFAHMMIAMCRALKIPARYVSGYLYNGPLDQLEGAQASHAWCEVYIPDFGWRALDPTNSQQADERYVKVAVGRDYADIVPVQGTYRGPSTKKMTVEVNVNLA
ncbi:MAG TPA: transglutaminase family protein [Chthoniobacteraceae bacterium]|jgi:transglutaminase-like putative cysteine protease|nr:transglutaminase family protein [Chthoniobacteraceae bacterium]